MEVCRSTGSVCSTYISYGAFMRVCLLRFRFCSVLQNCLCTDLYHENIQLASFEAILRMKSIYRKCYSFVQRNSVSHCCCCYSHCPNKYYFILFSLIARRHGRRRMKFSHAWALRILTFATMPFADSVAHGH